MKPTDRPASFDRLLLDHMDAIRRLVFRLTRIDREDVVSDAVADMLRHWDKFDATKASFYTWAMWRARGAVSNYRQRTQKVWDNETASDLPLVVIPAPQEHAAMLDYIYRHAETSRDVRMAIMAAHGMSSREIGSAVGVVPIYANRCVNEGRRALREAA